MSLKRGLRSFKSKLVKLKKDVHNDTGYSRSLKCREDIHEILVKLKMIEDIVKKEESKFAVKELRNHLTIPERSYNWGQVASDLGYKVISESQKELGNISLFSKVKKGVGYVLIPLAFFMGVSNPVEAKSPVFRNKVVYEQVLKSQDPNNLINNAIITYEKKCSNMNIVKYSNKYLSIMNEISKKLLHLDASELNSVGKRQYISGILNDTALAYKSKKEYKKAKFFYKKAIDIDNTNIVPLANLSYLLFKKIKNYDEARIYVNKLLKLDPNNSKGKYLYKKLLNK